MRRLRRETFIKIVKVGIFTSLITSGWVLWQHLKARKLQSDIDIIPYDIDEKHRRAGWFTKYRGQ